MAGEKEIDIFQSGLVPKHEILDEEEKAKFLKEMNISWKQLPRINLDDPAAKMLKAKRGDIIRITRKDLAGEYYYYRIVV